MNVVKTVVMATAVTTLLASAAMAGKSPESQYGGPIYAGAPALDVTASLLAAGGGVGSFSIATVLNSTVGPDAVDTEIAKLTKQYGRDNVDSWVTVFNFAVDDAIDKANAAGLTLPNSDLSGKALAGAIVDAGRDNHGVFYTGYFLDKVVSHNIYVQVTADIDDKYGPDADENYHRITNQAMVDFAHALGAKAKLAKFH